jgi:hypothetical protein
MNGAQILWRQQLTLNFGSIHYILVWCRLVCDSNWRAYHYQLLASTHFSPTVLNHCWLRSSALELFDLSYLSSSCTFLCTISDKLALLGPARIAARVARPRPFLEGCQCVRKFSWRSFCILQWCRLLSEHMHQMYIQIQETRERQLTLRIPPSWSRVQDHLQGEILQPRILPPVCNTGTVGCTSTLQFKVSFAQQFISSPQRSKYCWEKIFKIVEVNNCITPSCV